MNVTVAVSMKAGTQAGASICPAEGSRNVTTLHHIAQPLQRQLTDKVGEPVLLTIRLPFDEWFEVAIPTFTDRWGIAAGQEVDAAIEAASTITAVLSPEVRPFSSPDAMLRSLLLRWERPVRRRLAIAPD